MVGGSFDMSHEPHGSQAHGRIPYWVCLGPFWAMLGHFGPCWARVGTILGLSWAILGYVGTFWAMLEPYWAHLGPFGLFSDLCRPLFWTRAFQRRWLFVHARRVQKTPKIPGKTTPKKGKNRICGLRCWWFLLLFFGCFCFFLGACCSWAMFAWSRAYVGHCGLCWDILGHVEPRWNFVYARRLQKET